MGHRAAVLFNFYPRDHNQTQLVEIAATSHHYYDHHAGGRMAIYLAEALKDNRPRDWGTDEDAADIAHALARAIYLQSPPSTTTETVSYNYGFVPDHNVHFLVVDFTTRWVWVYHATNVESERCGTALCGYSFKDFMSLSYDQLEALIRVDTSRL